MDLGVIIPLDDVIVGCGSGLASMGFTSCQVVCCDEQMYTPHNAEKLKKILLERDLQITAFWSSWDGPKVWDFYSGPLVIGIVPQAYRYDRMKLIIKGAYFAKSLGVKNIAVHAGFIPENPNSENYRESICALQYISRKLKENEQNLLLETGTETPIALKRILDDVDMDNIGVNFDPANFLMYGTANPIDAVDILFDYIMGIHAKDGEYPVNGRDLGEEKPLGEGRVNFPLFIKKIKEMGYDGPITIEREIIGPQQKIDILTAKQLLEELL